MKKLQIVRVDNDLVQKADLQIGNNIIGRGAATGCDDGRIIKHAITINLAPNDEMTLTPVSPCYMKSTGSTRWQLLKLGSTVPIRPGDVCSLLPEKCWFKIICVPDAMENDSNEHASKRKANRDLDDSDIPDKKSCANANGEESMSASETLCEILDVNNSKVEGKDEEPVNTERDNKDDTDAKVSYLKDTCSASSSVEDDTKHAKDSNTPSNSQSSDQPFTLNDHDCKREDININKMATAAFKKNFKENMGAYLKTEDSPPSVTEDRQSPVPMQIDRPSASDHASNLREKCRYGKKCYRKNRQHKEQFSHPGDSDYDTPDDRNECPYGIHCYRKNPKHKLEFKHTVVHPRRKRKPVIPTSDNLSETDESSAEESVEESEYDPSTDIDSTDDETQWDKDESDLNDDGTTG